MGRSHKDLMEKYRTWAWYYMIKKLSGWSDYKLDMEFGYNQTPGDVPLKKRRRMFERIRVYANSPGRDAYAKRPFYLVDRVDSHELFKGTKDFYYSPFWELVSTHNVTIQQTYQLVQKGFHYFGLNRHIDPLLLDPVIKYEESINQIIKTHGVSLDLLALIGALYREAYLIGVPEVALIHHNQFSDLLEEYRHELLPNVLVDDENVSNVTTKSGSTDLSHDFAQLAKTRALYWQRSSDECQETYGTDPYDLITSPIY